MRLSAEEVNIIKQAVFDCFGKGSRVFLFGSRTDDQKRGGDIDLYIETTVKEKVFDKKLKMLELLHQKLGEQKIDIVINNFTASLYIYEVARQEGILL